METGPKGHIDGAQALRRAARIDANQPELVAAFRKLGCTVLPLHTIGKGAPDVLIAIGGRTALAELKTPVGKLRQAQIDFIDGWKGIVFVVRDLAGVETAVKTLRQA